MFKDNLFNIVSEDLSDSKADFIIHLNREHPIYSGHFPTDAITPGVCVVQIAVDLFSHIMQDEYHLARAKNIKFLQIIRPDEHDTIRYQLTWETLDDQTFGVKVIASDGDTVFTKMSIQVSKN